MIEETAKYRDDQDIKHQCNHKLNINRGTFSLTCISSIQFHLTDIEIRYSRSLANILFHINGKRNPVKQERSNVYIENISEYVMSKL